LQAEAFSGDSYFLVVLQPRHEPKRDVIALSLNGLRLTTALYFPAWPGIGVTSTRRRARGLLPLILSTRLRVLQDVPRSPLSSFDFDLGRVGIFPSLSRISPSVVANRESAIM